LICILVSVFIKHFVATIDSCDLLAKFGSDEKEESGTLIHDWSESRNPTQLTTGRMTSA